MTGVARNRRGRRIISTATREDTGAEDSLFFPRLLNLSILSRRECECSHKASTRIFRLERTSATLSPRRDHTDHRSSSRFITRVTFCLPPRVFFRFRSTFLCAHDEKTSSIFGRRNYAFLFRIGIESLLDESRQLANSAARRCANRARSRAQDGTDESISIRMQSDRV